MSDESHESHVLHTTTKDVKIEVPDEIAAEVALRIPPDASPFQVDDALRDHIEISPTFVTPDGSDAIAAILEDS
jgi:acetylornithine deacetylase/succinyl-diaminopimelate desuccinylase-like protein